MRPHFISQGSDCEPSKTKEEPGKPSSYLQHVTVNQRQLKTALTAAVIYEYITGLILYVIDHVLGGNLGRGGLGFFFQGDTESV
jgi:hypothetical protein